MRGKAQLDGRPVVEFIDDDDSRQTVNFSKRITERDSDWANYERLLTMKKYTNWTFTSPLLDDYRPWHCVYSVYKQETSCWSIDTVRTDGHDCRYSTIHVGLRRTKTPSVCIGQSRLNQIRHVTPQSHSTPTGLDRFPAINRQFRYSVQLPTSSVTKHHWYPTAWSSGLGHTGNYSAANLVLQ